ncbi:beta-1,3-galactosyltransferase 5-like [Spea bombifrons]|uniref:beta-1,3-galactosyltransferase 5-like n=1 Tax=Spea bombifrons TaxID=233779 RepID=UPI00234A33C4|nr:beta-1,3-galactosyltransferase 5-like [Spea bombifrons]
MALKRAWCLRFMLCVSSFLCLILLWSQLSPLFGEDRFHLTRPVSSSPKEGVDFSLLFSEDLGEPQCQDHSVLLILVTSHPSHIEQRKAIRKTWASPMEGAAYPWQVVFLIGRTLDAELDWHIHKEDAEHRDILMGNYVDTYRNLSLKVMHGMKWVADRCHPQYILKTDDDCFVNTDRLPASLALHSPAKTGLYVGSVFPREKRKVIRDPSSKWYVSQHIFPPDIYPPYASGIGYILSLDAVISVLKMAEGTPPIPVEDAYIGILAERAGISLLSSSRFTKYNMKWSVCNYRYLMVIHRVSPGDQELAQKNVLRARTECTRKAEVAHWH